jgi:hypothetical protein
VKVVDDVDVALEELVLDEFEVFDDALLMVDLVDRHVVVDEFTAEVEDVAVELPAVAKVWEYFPLPRSVTMYLCPKLIDCVGECPCSSSNVPRVIPPL